MGAAEPVTSGAAGPAGQAALWEQLSLPAAGQEAESAEPAPQQAAAEQAAQPAAQPTTVEAAQGEPTSAEQELAADQAAQIAKAAAARMAALAEAAMAAAMAAGLGRCAGPAPGTDDWHADRPAVVQGGARADVKAQMAARRENQERERAVREEELAWLAEYGQRREERDSSVW